MRWRPDGIGTIKEGKGKLGEGIGVEPWQVISRIIASIVASWRYIDAGLNLYLIFGAAHTVSHRGSRGVK